MVGMGGYSFDGLVREYGFFGFIWRVIIDFMVIFSYFLLFFRVIGRNYG